MPSSPTESSSADSAPRQEVPYDFPPRRNSILAWLEFLIVASIGVAIFLILGLAISSILGIFIEQYNNIIEEISQLEGHWKTGLIIMIPLFFLPIFKFLMNLKEGPGGLSTGSKMRATGGKTTNTYKPKP